MAKKPTITDEQKKLLKSSYKTLELSRSTTLTKEFYNMTGKLGKTAKELAKNKKVQKVKQLATAGVTAASSPIIKTLLSAFYFAS